MIYGLFGQYLLCCDRQRFVKNSTESFFFKSISAAAIRQESAKRWADLPPFKTTMNSIMITKILNYTMMWSTFVVWGDYFLKWRFKGRQNTWNTEKKSYGFVTTQQLIARDLSIRIKASQPRCCRGPNLAIYLKYSSTFLP